MKINFVLRLISNIIVFIGAFIGIYSIQNNKNYTKGLNQFMKIGIIPLGFISAFRHIILTGSIMKNQQFFEFEAGGINLAIAIAAIVALTQKMSNNSLGLIFLIYAIYLFMAMIASILYNPKSSNIMIISFIGMVGLLLYFTYIAFTKKDNDKKNLI